MDPAKQISDKARVTLLRFVATTVSDVGLATGLWLGPVPRVAARSIQNVEGPFDISGRFLPRSRIKLCSLQLRLVTLHQFILQFKLIQQYQPSLFE